MEITPLLQRRTDEDEEEKPAADKGVLFDEDALRKDEEEEQRTQQGGFLQPSRSSGQWTVSEATLERIEGVRDTGGALDPADRSFMERRFGRSFEGVTVQNDSHAHQMCASLGADAFTRGKDIFFGYGRYEPSSGEGRKLLAHELAHVIQQQRASVPAVQRTCQSFPAHTAPDTYCETREEAEALVTRACPPDNTDFLYRDGPSTHLWRPIPGYGCAHWVAHRLNITNGPSYANCLGGFSVTIGQITEGRTAQPLTAALNNDIWSSGVHSGIVREVDAPNARVRIEQCGVGGAVSSYWVSTGDVYR